LFRKLSAEQQLATIVGVPGRNQSLVLDRNLLTRLVLQQAQAHLTQHHQVGLGMFQAGPAPVLAEPMSNCQCSELSIPQ
jgi:hypothetical protein